MRPPVSDLTAGKRARKIAADPDAPQRITDPTDRRYGESELDSLNQPTDVQRIADPTDTEYGEPAA